MSFRKAGDGGGRGGHVEEAGEKVEKGSMWLERKRLGREKVVSSLIFPGDILFASDSRARENLLVKPSELEQSETC